MSSIRQCANIKGALLKYNNVIVRSKIKAIQSMKKGKLQYVQASR